jgi:hypothetical protein
MGFSTMIQEGKSQNATIHSQACNQMRTFLWLVHWLLIPDLSTNRISAHGPQSIGCPRAHEWTSKNTPCQTPSNFCGLNITITISMFDFVRTTLQWHSIRSNQLLGCNKLGCVSNKLNYGSWVFQRLCDLQTQEWQHLSNTFWLV